MILDQDNEKTAREFFHTVLDLAVDFKLQDEITTRKPSPALSHEIIEPLPREGVPLTRVLEEFSAKLLPYCVNVASPHYMGLPYVGNAVAPLAGALLDVFLQQNLMNFDWAPSATYTEIAVLQWLREIVGYRPCRDIGSLWDVGGIITSGGTASNTAALLLAREHHLPGTRERGITNPEAFGVIAPSGIVHHTLREAKKWCGCGSKLIEVETVNFRMDIQDLKDKLRQNRGNVMAVVAYAGDSKTTTIDNLPLIAETVKAADEGIWLHADACHGFSLGFSEKLREKIRGLELFDSVSADPHKVLNVSIPLSALLVRDPGHLQLLATSPRPGGVQDESLSFGKITPFFASRPWMSLKFWFLMKNMGLNELGKMIDQRYELAQFLAGRLRQDKEFLLLNQVDMNSVMFFYKGSGQDADVPQLNAITGEIHQRLNGKGFYNIQRASIQDPGLFLKGALLRPLQFMSGNPRTTQADVIDMLSAVKRAGRECTTGA